MTFTYLVKGMKLSLVPHLRVKYQYKLGGKQCRRMTTLHSKPEEGRLGTMSHTMYASSLFPAFPNNVVVSAQDYATLFKSYVSRLTVRF